MRTITLITDFGLDSCYVAEMKGAILSVCNDVRIIDASHSVEPQNVLQGALALRQFADAFPRGTVHVGVVDPGVGSARRILLVSRQGQLFVGPDNGLLTFVLSSADEVRKLDQPEFWRAEVSSTFHGRDIMGPVAAHLCAGQDPERMSSPLESEPVLLEVPMPTFAGNALQGEIINVDSFGNMISNIGQDDVARLSARTSRRTDARVSIGGRSLELVSTYADSEHGNVVALFGSGGWLEVTVSGGNASESLGIGRGELVRFEFAG